MTSQDPVTREVARRLIAYREQLKLTQELLAKLSGVSRTTIANIEGHRQGIPLPLLYKLCKGMNVDPASLLPAPDEIPEGDSRKVEIDGVTHELPVGVANAINAVLSRKSRRTE